MKVAVVVTALIFVAGCTSVLDPAPYRAPFVSGYSNLPVAQTSLQGLAKNYGDQTDEMAREQLGFDALLIGVPIATGVNAAFRGAKDVTTGLGLASGAVGGLKIYFGPQSKVTAYNNATVSLSCAASFAGELDSVATSNGSWAPSGLTLYPQGASFSSLSDYITGANTLIIFGEIGGQPLALSSEQKSQLVTVSDTAKKAYTDLTGSFATIETTPATLATFANSVSTSTASRILGSEQNVASALSAIQPSSGKPPAAPASGTASLLAAPTPQQQLDDLMANLPSLSTNGEAVATRLNAEIATFSTCALPKT